MNIWKARPLESMKDLRPRLLYRLLVLSFSIAILLLFFHRAMTGVWYYAYVVVVYSVLGVIGDLYMLKHPETSKARVRLVFYPVALVLLVVYRFIF